MRVVIQRVKKANVVVENKEIGKINQGVLVFLGIEDNDNQEDINWLVRKLLNLRIFNDDSGVMNLSLTATNGEVLVISQFTLHASTKKGNRPSYIKAAKPKDANLMYDNFVVALKNEIGDKVQTGKFGADMKVSLLNDGPVTILMDSKNRE